MYRVRYFWSSRTMIGRAFCALKRPDTFFFNFFKEKLLTQNWTLLLKLFHSWCILIGSVDGLGQNLVHLKLKVMISKYIKLKILKKYFVSFFVLYQLINLVCRWAGQDGFGQWHLQLNHLIGHNQPTRPSGTRGRLVYTADYRVRIWKNKKWPVPKA